MWRWVASGVGCLLLLMFYGMYLESTPEGAERIRQQEAIAQCRKAQDDPLAELSDRRLTRDVCDRMERDYRARWGSPP